MIHTLNHQLLGRAVNVLVVGAGGTGSHMLTGLAQMHHAMVALGHPGGLNVTVMDADTVSTTNVARQMFFPSDVGRNKAEVLVQRINMAMGLRWEAWAERLTDEVFLNRWDIIIGCVDNRATRATIAAGEAYRPIYWLDAGNTQHGGQIVLGQIGQNKELPHVGDLLPETLDGALDAGDDTPSCSMAEALERQSLYTNRAMALYGLNLLADLFRYGKIDYHGVFVNLKSARTTPIKIDPATWERMGYKDPRAAKAAKTTKKAK